MMAVETLTNRFLGTSGTAAGAAGDVNPFGLSLPFGTLRNLWFDYATDSVQRTILFWDALRRGVRLNEGATLDLKDITAPVVVFASGGDNITPPQQALNWIVDVYGNEEEIKIHGQTIVYIRHKDIGHLGIFVSGKVAQKEHYEINEAIDFIDTLPSGLYEMVIERLDDGQQEVEYFAASKLLSELNTQFYEAFVGPWIRMAVTEPVAKTLRDLHPLRMQYRLLSDENPLLWPLQLLAPLVTQNRRPVADDNPFKIAEKRASDALVDLIDHYRALRDRAQETAFKAIYGPKALGTFLRLLKEQAYMVQLDPERAIESLAHLLPTPEERRTAWNMAKAIAIGDGVIDAKQQAILDRLAEARELKMVA